VSGVWRISSACVSGECVEVRRNPDGTVSIRNSTDPDRILTVTGAEWEMFRAGVAAGEFNLPEEAQ
jgi:hypothetical protein